MDLTLFLVLAFILAFIPAAIAKSKGHSAVEWWLFGLLLFIIALPCALLLKPRQGFVEQQQIAEGMKKCPACAEMIRAEAIKCRYCGTSFTTEEIVKSPVRPAVVPTTNRTKRETKLIAILLMILFSLTVALAAIGQ